MKEKKIVKKLEQSLNEKRFIRLKGRHPEREAYDGIVIHIGDGYFAMRTFNELVSDGIDIFPNEVIKGYRDNEFEQCYREILVANGELDDLRIPEWLTDCPRLGDVIVKLHLLDIWPGIEEVYADDTSALFIGPITKVKRNTFRIKCYDATGEWEEEYKRQYDWIYRISIDGTYISRFNAYMRAKDAAAATEE